MIASTRSRFDGMRPVYAWLLLLLAVGLSVYGVCLRDKTQALTTNVAKDLNKTDFALYQRIVDRVHAGEGYYQAAGAELRAGNFPLRPFMTWRPPTVACVMAMFPSARASRVVIIVLVVAALMLWIVRLKEEGPLWMPIVGGILLFLSMGVGAIKPSYLHHETWSGTCIMLSLALYARKYQGASVAFGLAALFLRELALPFVVVMLVMAWQENRKREALAWLCGLIGFAIFLGIHAWMVSRQLTPADVRVGPGWLHMGGWPFVIKTARANVVFLASYSWVAGLLLPFLLLGLAGWSSEVGERAALTVGMYVVAFLFAGRAYHAYWGLMYSSLLPLGFVLAPRALQDLLRAALPKHVPAQSEQPSTA